MNRLFVDRFTTPRLQNSSVTIPDALQDVTLFVITVQFVITYGEYETINHASTPLGAGVYHHNA